MNLIAHNCPSCGPVLGDLCREDMSVACAVVVVDWHAHARRSGCRKRLYLCRAHGLRTSAEPGACGCIEAAKKQVMGLVGAVAA